METKLQPQEHKPSEESLAFPTLAENNHTAAVETETRRPLDILCTPKPCNLLLLLVCRVGFLIGFQTSLRVFFAVDPIPEWT